VLLEHADSHTSLIIEDDGTGCDPDRLLSGDGNGLGLIGMRERASSVGGTLEIESKPDEGTTIYVRIPG
jgi:two-component system sensor histidine kinase NreB